ncbi:MAG: hypothetical protein RR224_07990 [Clostridia bacterium]
MEITIWLRVREIIACTLTGVRIEQIKIPAKHAAVSVYWPCKDVVDVAAFAPLLGVPLVAAVECKDDWLLFRLTDAFYSACVDEVLRTLPPVEEDRGEYTLNRMLCFAGKHGTGCPADAQIQRALWLTLGAQSGLGAKRSAQQALLTLAIDCLPKERMTRMDTCGALADACARLLYHCGME